jgi:hypothetical protein
LKEDLFSDEENKLNDKIKEGEKENKAKMF